MRYKNETYITSDKNITLVPEEISQCISLSGSKPELLTTVFSVHESKKWYCEKPHYFEGQEYTLGCKGWDV